MVWYSHLFQNFPQFIVIHTVKGFGVVHRAEIDVFLEISCFFDDPVDADKLTCEQRPERSGVFFFFNSCSPGRGNSAKISRRSMQGVFQPYLVSDPT